MCVFLCPYVFGSFVVVVLFVLFLHLFLVLVSCGGAAENGK